MDKSQNPGGSLNFVTLTFARRKTMTATEAFSLKHLLIALAGAAGITWLAASLSPAPRFDLVPASSEATAPRSAFGVGELGGNASNAPRWTAPPQRIANDAPATPAPAEAKAPRGRSYKCVIGGRVEYADRPCADGADSSLVNVNPALVGAVPTRR